MEEGVLGSFPPEEPQYLLPALLDGLYTLNSTGLSHTGKAPAELKASGPHLRIPTWKLQGGLIALPYRV